MSDSSAGVVAQVSGALAGVAKSLLGPLASYPNAWLRRPSKAIDDVTDARSFVSGELAKAAAEKMKQDPAVLAAAIELFTPGAIRKLQNTAMVIAAASENLDGNDVGIDPDVDWLNAFHRFAEDASTDRMRKVFGKILAGEIVTPGSYSIASIRTIAELSPDIAELFSQIYANSIDYWFLKNPDVRGEDWMILTDLEDCGLVSLRDCVLHQPPGTHWMFGGSTTYILANMTGEYGIKLPIFNFTRVGVELGSLLPDRNYEPTLRQIASKIRGQAASITLVKENWSEQI